MDAAAVAARILIVEDDDTTRKSLADGLSLDGHEVFTASAVAMARRLLGQTRMDVVLLDVNLPGESGYALLRELRAKQPATNDANAGVPVLMVSGRNAEIDRIRGFELGCDDYVVKPYSFTELRGRIAAVLRRSAESPEDDEGPLVIGRLTIDRRSREVDLDGRDVKLTVKEYELLLAMSESPNRVHTRAELMERVWGFRSSGSTRTLDAHVCRLRAKLSGTSERYVVNVWGVGYRLTDPLSRGASERS